LQDEDSSELIPVRPSLDDCLAFVTLADVALFTLPKFVADVTDVFVSADMSPTQNRRSSFVADKI